MRVTRNSVFSLAPKRIAQGAILGLLALGTIGVTAAAPANAAGTSAPIFNCYTQWWNTAWAQKCSSPGAKFAGTYYSGVTCSGLDGDGLMSVVRTKGSTATRSGGDCLYSASDGWIDYR
jgi:hypothetical protein